MENKQTDEISADSVVSKWRNLVRQQSSKIGTLADNVVLPKNERIARQKSKIENMELQTVEAQHAHAVGMTEEGPAQKKTEHFPIFMIGISVIQIILFYCFDEKLLTMKFGYDPHRRHEIWRFVTSVFVHNDYAHLWGNVVCQLVLGVFLEIVHKWRRIAIIYFASAFGGSLLITVLDNSTYCVGASTGFMGLLFSHLATITLNWNEMDRKISRLFCVSLYIAYVVGTALYSEMVLEEKTNTSHAGHLGGAIFGFLVSILVLKNFKKLPWEDTMKKMCVGILIAIFVIIFAINVTARDYFPTNEWNVEYEKSYYEAFPDHNTAEISTEGYIELYDEE